MFIVSRLPVQLLPRLINRFLRILGLLLVIIRLLLQLLPFCPDDVIDKIEANVNKLPAVTAMLGQGMTPEEICALALDGMEYDILDTYEPEYRCTCSREKVERAFAAMSREDRLSLPNEEGVAEATCRFCDAVYTFTREDLERIGK